MTGKKLSTKNGNNVDQERHVSEIKDGKVRKRLSRACEEYRDLQEQINALKAAQDLAKEEIKELAKSPELATMKSVRGEGWLLTKVAGRRSETISAAKLVEQGVGMDVIEKAKEVKEGSPYYTVKGAK